MPTSSAQRSFWHLFYPLWQWLVFVPVGVLVTVISALLAVAVSLFSPRVANLQIASRWARVLARLSLVRVDIEGLDQIDPDRSYVVVANHQSQFDIPLIYGYCGLDLRWVMKAELRKLPFVSAGCRAIGHVFIDRADPEQARVAISEAVARLQDGTGLLFFPEGTRSRSGRLLPFKKGAFRVAVDQQMDILPMSVVGTRDVLPADSVRLRPGRVRLRIHPPVSTKAFGVGDIERIRSEVTRTIASVLPEAS